MKVVNRRVAVAPEQFGLVVVSEDRQRSAVRKQHPSAAVDRVDAIDRAVEQRGEQLIAVGVQTARERPVGRGQRHLVTP